MIKKKILVAVLATLPLQINAEQNETINLEEVSVTAPMVDTGYATKNSTSATRTDTPIKETPQSIVVINRNVIDDQQSVTLSEALSNASSVVANQLLSTPAFDDTRIRGFRAEQLIDGFTQFYNPGDRESLVNVQQIEVLKGSNAVLYGGGAGAPVGGVINIVSKLPQNKAFGEVGIKFGSYDFVQPFFDINQPLNENVLFRVTGEYTSTESNMDVIEQKRYNINPAITFTNNDDTSLTLQAKFSRWKQQEHSGLPATGTVAGNFRIKDDLFIGDRNIPDSSSEYKGLWATFDHKFNDQWAMNVKARVSNSEFDEYAQSIGNEPGSLFFPLGPTEWTVSNVYLAQKQKEKTILANTSYKFNWGGTKNTLLMGADYSELKDEGTMYVGDGGTVNLLNPVFNTFVTPTAADLVFFDGNVRNTIYGTYVQMQSDIQERLHLLAALRQGTVKVDYVERSPFYPGTNKTDQSDLLPRLGAVLDLNKAWSVFASFSEGLRGVPFAPYDLSVAPEPERSRNREAGVKFNIADELQGQFAFYHVDRSNVAVSDPFTFRSLPNGEQRSRGFDTDLTWQLNNSWKLLANYAYTEAEYTKQASTTVLVGNKVQGVPKNSARLWANYNFASLGIPGLSAGLGANWQSEAYVDNANTYKADSFYTMDAAVNYQTPRYNLALTLKNLTHQDYYQYYYYLGGRLMPDNGTTAYLSASFKY